jgi:hypothetical protein
LPNSNINFSKNSKKTHHRGTKASQQTFITATAKVFQKKQQKYALLGTKAAKQTFIKATAKVF